MNLSDGHLPIEKKCELIDRYFLPLKPALIDLNEIILCARISLDSPNSRNFASHSSFLDYVQNRLLAIFGSALRYSFVIWFCSDQNAIKYSIASILQLPLIKRCTNVEIQIPTWGVQNKLPVEAISNWLEKSTDGVGINSRKQREKLLKMWLHSIQNAREMVDHLEMVYFFDFKAKFQLLFICVGHNKSKLLG